MSVEGEVVVLRRENKELRAPVAGMEERIVQLEAQLELRALLPTQPVLNVDETVTRKMESACGPGVSGPGTLCSSAFGLLEDRRC
jgi:hypothetical protein